MKKKTALAATLAVAALFAVGTAVPAFADQDGTINAGDAAMYYNPGVAGDFIDYNHAYGSFCNVTCLTLADGSARHVFFHVSGVGRDGNFVPNDAGSLLNLNLAQWARTYSGNNWTGSVNTVDPGSSHNFTVEIHNHNNSFQFINIG